MLRSEQVFRRFVLISILAVLIASAASARQPDVFDAPASIDQVLGQRISAAHSAVVLDATVGMVCPPPVGGSPPCVVPTGLDPDLVAPNPSGELRIVAFGNDTALAGLELEGLAPGMVVTAWLVFVPPGAPPPAPIFAPIGPGLPPVAAPSSPLAPTFARFSEGTGWEPNRFRVHADGDARLVIWLDYDPLEPGQAPLRNGMVSIVQGLAPAGSEAEQTLCCPDAVIPPAPGPRLSPIGSSFLRRFDPATGFQVLDAAGRPEIVRSPVPAPLVVVVVHVDRMTHGIHPGIVIPPVPGLPATAGDHYVLGVFPLSALGT